MERTQKLCKLTKAPAGKSNPQPPRLHRRLFHPPATTAPRPPSPRPSSRRTGILIPKLDFKRVESEEEIWELLAVQRRQQMPPTRLENTQTCLGVCLPPFHPPLSPQPPLSNPRSNLTRLPFSACMFGGAMCLLQPQASSLY